MAKTGTSTVKQRVLIGFESDTAPGVAVPATWKPRSGKFDISPSSERGEITPAGEQFPAALFEKDRWAEGSVSDATPCYREQAYVDRLVCGRPAIIETTIAGQFERTFTFGGYDVPTMTVQKGDDETAGRATGVFATGISMEWSRNGRTSTYEVQLNGGDWQDGVTLTPDGTVTQVALAPITGQHIQVRLGDSVAAIAGRTNGPVTGTSSVVDVLSVKVNLGGTNGRVRYFNRDELVSLFADGTVELTMAKAQGIALIDELRSGEKTKYLGVSAVSGGRQHLFMAAVGLSAEGAREDESGAFVVKPTLRILSVQNLKPTFRLISDLTPYAGEAFQGSATGDVTADKPTTGGTDSDGDGVPDSTDLEPNNPGIS